MNKSGIFGKKNNRYTLAFFTTSTQYHIVRRQWPGILDACKRFDVNLLVIVGGLRLTETPSSMPNVIFDLFDNNQADGIMCWSSTLFHEITTAKRDEFLHRYKSVPIISQGVLLAGIPSLFMDCYHGVYEAIDHLIKVHACRRIAFTRGPIYHHYAEERFQAYKDALRDNGIPINPKLISDPLMWSKEDGRKAVKQLIDERRQKPCRDIEAVVTVNDGHAIGIIRELQERGIKVPKEIAVIGFNDDPETQFFTPALTTVRAPLYELGEYGITLLLKMIEGKSIPLVNKVPAKLVIRQSCGCFSSGIVEAAAVISIRAAGNKLESLPEKQYAGLINELKGEIHAQLETGLLKTLIDSFFDALAQENTEIFLLSLNDLLFHTINIGAMVEKWYTAILIFKYRLMPYLKDSKEIAGAEKLFQQAHIEIGETVRRIQGSNDLCKIQHWEQLQDVGSKLITTFNVSELMNIIYEKLPGLGISIFYLSIYEDPQKPTEWAKLLLAYKQKSRTELKPEGRRFPANQIIPDNVLPGNERFTLTMSPLYFEDNQLGYVLMDAEVQDSSIYEILRQEISSALFGAILIQRNLEDTREIAKQKYILDTFMDTIPDRIFFKDREGRITRANYAHAKRRGLNSPSDEIGKTDFDFFSEEEAMQKRKHEEEIINTGKSVIALEESILQPDGNYTWSQTTKMPLCNEKGDIIGIFGISHDITELKLAQKSIEKANLEIKELNKRLTDENLQMKTEMDLAYHIQTSLLPETTENIHADFEIIAKMLPAEMVGGDYYDVSLDKAGNLWLGIGDVSGHGVTPGLIMMMTQTIHTAITINYATSASHMINKINRVLIKNVQGRLKENYFMTFTALKYQGNGLFQYAGAHLDMIVYRKEQSKFELIPTPGPWLNVIPDIEYATENSYFTMDTGDILFLYTDGIVEAENSQDELLERKRFIEIIQKHVNNDLLTMRDNILSDVLNWCNQKNKDDITLLIIKRIPGNPG